MPIPLATAPCILRLHNLSFSPENVRFKLKLRIEFIEGKKMPQVEFLFANLFFNPAHKDTLFFKSDKHDYTDIELPRGLKKVKYSILSSDGDMQYEVSLNCMYIKPVEKSQERYAIADFDILKVNASIVELCDQCIDAEGVHEIFGSAYSGLINEIETIIKKRVFLTDLPDELIEFRKITRP